MFDESCLSGCLFKKDLILPARVHRERGASRCFPKHGLGVARKQSAEGLSLFLVQSLWNLQARVCQELPIPECEGRADGPTELDPDGVDDRALLRVHQAKPAGIVVQQHPDAIRLSNQSHWHHLVGRHGKPLALNVAKHPGGVICADAVFSRHGCLCHSNPELLRLAHRYFPVVLARGDATVTKHHCPVAETLRVVLHLTGVKAQNAVDDASVSLKQV